jgi:hypothetical protein
LGLDMGIQRCYGRPCGFPGSFASVRRTKAFTGVTVHTLFTFSLGVGRFDNLGRRLEGLSIQIAHGTPRLDA